MIRAVRAAALWSIGSVAVLGVVRWLGPSVLAVRSPHADFDDLLTGVAAVVLIGALGWLWLVATLTLGAAALHADPVTSGTGRWLGPVAVRRAVLAACGLSVVVSIAGPAVAGAPAPATDRRPGPPPLAGLPLPVRPTGLGPTPETPPRSGDRAVVRPGDTLWGLAADRLPVTAGDAAVAEGWQRIYAANAQVIGPDPDLIRPGVELRLPPLPALGPASTHPSEEP